MLNKLVFMGATQILNGIFYQRISRSKSFFQMNIVLFRFRE